MCRGGEAGGTTIVRAGNETEEGDPDIAITSPGQPGVRLLGDSGDDSYPDISSDGSHVARISVHDNRTVVYLYDVSTGNATRVTSESAGPSPAPVQTSPAGPTPAQTFPVQTSPPGSGNGLTITGADIAALQWQESPELPGWLTAEDPERGLTFYMNPNSPDIILIETASGTWYGYSISTGYLTQVQV